MKFNMALAASAIVAVAVAQDLSGIPECALQCIKDATTSSTKCKAEEYSCQCEPANLKTITAAATPCVFEECTPEDAVKTISGTKALCASLPEDEEPASSAAPPASSEAPPASSEAPPASTSAEAPATSAEAPASSSVAAPSGTAAPSSVVGAPGTVYVTVCDSSSTKVAVPTNPGSNGTAAPTPTASKGPEFTAAAAKVGAGLSAVAAFALAALAL